MSMNFFQAVYTVHCNKAEKDVKAHWLFDPRVTQMLKNVLLLRVVMVLFYESFYKHFLKSEFRVYVFTGLRSRLSSTISRAIPHKSLSFIVFINF